MALRERKVGKYVNKFCNVVDELIVLEELGFKEDNYHRWFYTLYESKDGKYNKSIIASGDYLYVKDSSGNGVDDNDLCTLWNKDIAGCIKKREIEDFINLLKQGNVRTKRD